MRAQPVAIAVPAAAGAPGAREASLGVASVPAAGADFPAASGGPVLFEGQAAAIPQ